MIVPETPREQRRLPTEGPDKPLPPKEYIEALQMQIRGLERVIAEQEEIIGILSTVRVSTEEGHPLYKSRDDYCFPKSYRGVGGHYTTPLLVSEGRGMERIDTILKKIW